MAAPSTGMFGTPKPATTGAPSSLFGAPIPNGPGPIPTGGLFGPKPTATPGASIAFPSAT